MSTESEEVVVYEQGEGADKGIVAAINDRLNKELADPAALRALVATTFNGMDEMRVKQALMEGMIRGFKFEDFLHKNVYAIPYGQKYSLVTSIDHARKTGMKSGVIGKGAPEFTYKDAEKKNIESCTVTIKRLVNGHIGEFTATVDFDEYVSTKGVWKEKPKTMIAKVAEMHALRMACPEVVADMYTEEEFAQSAESKEAPQKVDVITTNESDVQDCLDELKKATTHEEMMSIYANFKPAIKMNDRIQDHITNTKFENNG